MKNCSTRIILKYMFMDAFYNWDKFSYGQTGIDINQ